MDNYERELLRSAMELLNRLAGRLDAQEDFKPTLRLSQNGTTLMTFRGGRIEKQPPAERQEAIILEKPDVGTSDEERGFVEFTEKEIKQMPEQFRRVITCNRKRCCMRVHVSGKNATTYEIRYRRDGYNLSACGKTIELAKARMIAKMQNAVPKNTKNGLYTIPTTFSPFALYYFETFRKEKVVASTYRKDLIRFQKYLKPHFGEKPFKQITPLDCKTLLDQIKATGKGKTADEVYSLMSVIFKGAIAHGIIERNPLSIVLHVQHKSENGIALTRQEEDLLLEQLPPQYRTAAALILYCGLRPFEVQSVEICGDFIRTVNSKRKTRKTEYKRIPIIDRLKPYLPADGKLKLLGVALLREHVRRILPEHKLYDLRTTFNTRCTELGVAEAARKHFMGHSLGALGNAYTDLSDEYLLKEGKKLNKW